MPDPTLTLVWAGIIVFAVFAYVVLDGFDLGIGILSIWFGSEERGLLMSSIAPVWDGNETWLVLGGGGLMAAFPLAYAVLMPALYTPLIAMLLGLIFRGVAFEFRWRTRRARPLWDRGFWAGSLLAGFMQGVALGAILQGIPVHGRQYGGGWWTWLSPFSVLTGLALLSGYAALGAGWIILKTEGPLQGRGRRLARLSGAGLVLGIVAVSAVTPSLQPGYYHRWFAWPTVVLTAQVPLLLAIVSALYALALRRDWERAPFLLTLSLFALSFLGLGISIYPFLVPTTISIWAAAAPRSTQLFMLVGTAVLIPVILGYTGMSYWVFRGKVGAAGHH